MDSFIGEIKLWTPAKIPVDWAACDGSELPINTYQALYSLIGTTYGGNGVTTFGLPDLRGSLPIGQGAGTGLTPRVLAQEVGADTVTLTTANLPPHNHPMCASSEPATTGTPGPTTVLAAPAGNFYNNGSAGTTLVAFHDVAVAPAGGDQAHENRMPSTAINYIICLNGIYPSRP